MLFCIVKMIEEVNSFDIMYLILLNKLGCSICKMVLEIIGEWIIG